MRKGRRRGEEGPASGALLRHSVPAPQLSERAEADSGDLSAEFKGARR